MKTIYKYPLPIDGKFKVDLPKHRKILSFQSQNDIPTLWVLVDPDTPVESVGFHMYGTGHPMGYFGNYIGTIQTFGGGLVWHLFED